MNDKLKELATKAMVEHCVSHVRLEEFANLIIQECARIAAATPCPYKDDRMIQNLGHTWDMACVSSANRVRNIMTGADIHAGDGGYSIGTEEGYNEFLAKRNQSYANE